MTTKSCHNDKGRQFPCFQIPGRERAAFIRHGKTEPELVVGETDCRRVRFRGMQGIQPLKSSYLYFNRVAEESPVKMPDFPMFFDVFSACLRPVSPCRSRCGIIDRKMVKTGKTGRNDSPSPKIVGVSLTAGNAVSRRRTERSDRMCDNPLTSLRRCAGGTGYVPGCHWHVRFCA